MLEKSCIILVWNVGLLILMESLLQPSPQGLQIPSEPHNILLHVFYGHLCDTQLRYLLCDGLEESLNLNTKRMNENTVNEPSKLADQTTNKQPTSFSSSVDENWITVPTIISLIPKDPSGNLWEWDTSILYS